MATSRMEQNQSEPLNSPNVRYNGLQRGVSIHRHPHAAHRPPARAPSRAAGAAAQRGQPVEGAVGGAVGRVGAGAEQRRARREEHEDLQFLK